MLRATGCWVPHGPEGASPSDQRGSSVGRWRVRLGSLGTNGQQDRCPTTGGREWDTPSLASPCKSILRRGPPVGFAGRVAAGWRRSLAVLVAPWVVAGELSYPLTRLGPLAVREFGWSVSFGKLNDFVPICRLAQPWTPSFRLRAHPPMRLIGGSGALGIFFFLDCWKFSEEIY